MQAGQNKFMHVLSSLYIALSPPPLSACNIEKLGMHGPGDEASLHIRTLVTNSIN